MIKKFTYGFTLIELLVVIAIIGLLAVIIVLPLREAYQKTQITKVVTRLKEIEKGLLSAVIEEGRDTYWTQSELGKEEGTGTVISIADLLAIEYPNPGYAIKHYLSRGHTQKPPLFNANPGIRYQNLSNILPDCGAALGGVSLGLGTASIPLAKKITYSHMINFVIDGNESNSQCGKYSPGNSSSGWSYYRLSRNSNSIDF